MFCSLRDSQQELLPPNPHRKNKNVHIYEDILDKIKELSTISLNSPTKMRTAEGRN